MNSTLPRDGIRPRARRLMSRLAAVLMVASVGLGVPAAASADDTEDVATAAAVELFISTGSGTQIEPGGTLLSTVTLDNSTDSALTAGTATIELNRTALSDGSALDAWLDAGTASGGFEAIATEPTPVVADGTTTSMSVVVDAAALHGLAPGVYPIRVRTTGSTTSDTEGQHPWNLTATSVVVIHDATPRSTAVLVPITATPQNDALLTADELATLTAPDGSLAGQLDAVTDSSAILAVDPAIVASIRMLGSSAPQSALAWLQRLQALPNEVFALQFGDADATVQAHAALPDLVGAPDLTPLLEDANFPAATPTPSPSPSPDTTPEPSQPENDELVAINGAQGGLLWPRANVTEKDLDAFSGYLGDAVTTILPSTTVESSGPHATVGAHDVLVTDAAASARLSAAVELTERPAIDRELTAAAGHLFFAEQKSATVILALDRSESRSPVALRDAVSAFATPASSLAQLRASVAAPATLASVDVPDRVAGLKAMLADQQRLTSFATILETPALLLTPDLVRIMRAIGVGVTDEQYAERTTAQAERVRTTLDSVAIQRPKPVQLFTSAAPLPVWVRNDLPWTVNLTLHGKPSNPRLDMQSETPVTALASGITRIEVPLEALVASGQVDVRFTLTSPTNVPIGQPEVAGVTLRADWERIGLVILGGIIIVLLTLGIVRTVRRRKAKPDVDEPSPDAAGASSSKEQDG